MEAFLILIYIASVIIGVYVGSKKGEGCISFIMTILLGPFWLPFIFISKGNKIECPYCHELINKNAVKCPFCQSNLMTERKCNNCGYVNDDDANFCVKCGKAIQ